MEIQAGGMREKTGIEDVAKSERMEGEAPSGAGVRKNGRWKFRRMELERLGETRRP